MSAVRHHQQDVDDRLGRKPGNGRRSGVLQPNNPLTEYRPDAHCFALVERGPASVVRFQVHRRIEAVCAAQGDSVELRLSAGQGVVFHRIALPLFMCYWRTLADVPELYLPGRGWPDRLRCPWRSWLSAHLWRGFYVWKGEGYFTLAKAPGTRARAGW